MVLEESYLYHTYNQGNNSQRVFFGRENYLYFLRKIRKHVLPHADVLAWCLMPNHFHLMVRVRHEVVEVSPETDQLRSLPNSVGVTPSHTDTINPPIKQRTSNELIGIMLRSYTRAINKQESRTDKLFREKTKAECLNYPNGITPSFITSDGISEIIVTRPEKQYPQICFEYIHQNPVKAGLAKRETDWEFSSAPDYAGLRNGKLVNKDVALEFVDYGR